MIDFINAMFELFGSFATIVNIVKIISDKQIKGISLWTCVFFTTWSIWNIGFYSTLQQPVSLIFSVLMCILNLVWLVLAFYYKNLREII